MFTKFTFVLFVTLLFILYADIQAQTDPGTANLKHSWTFNDGTEKDQVGDAHGTIMGNAAIIDGVLSTIDGDAWMEMPGDVIAVNGYDELTMETWIIPLANANTGYHMVIYLGNSVNSLGSDGCFISPARGDNKCRAAISCGNEGAPYSAESGADGPELDDGILHHVVSTISGTDITLYIDGQLQMSTPLSATNAVYLLNNTYAYVAKGGYTGDPAWKGEILEVNLYNKALTADEILFLYNKGAAPVGVEDKITAPKEFKLMQNYPNPFNPETTIDFSLANSGYVDLTVFDVLGRPVATLVKGELEQGNHSVKLNASNLSSGVYIYALNTGNFKDVKKLTIMK